MAIPGSPVRYRQTLIDAIAAVAHAAASVPSQPELSQAMGYLAGAFRRHQIDCEGAEGLLATVASDAPRLISTIEELCREHEEISEEVRALRLRLDREDGPSPGTREEIMALLDSLTAHDQREVGLMLDAYNVDVGGGD